jgi:hypothetical protein
MSMRSWILAALGASLVVNLALAGLWWIDAGDPAVPAPEGGILANFRRLALAPGDRVLMPVIPLADRETFEAVTYGDASAWNPFNEFPVAGRVLPVRSPAARDLILSAPAVPGTLAGIETLFAWTVDCLEGPCREAFARSLRKRPADTFDCSDRTSILRTILLARGFFSRAMDFEFKDGYGKDSHTFAEVWAPDRKAWLYFDPLNRVYSRTRSARDLIGLPRPDDVVYLPAGDPRADSDRRDTVATVFREGWKLWSISNGLNGSRIVFLDPDLYGPFEGGAPTAQPDVYVAPPPLKDPG